MKELEALKVLARIGELQTVKARHMCCPRCGEDRMRQPAHTNAYSRHADCYVCPECGTEEAMLDYTGTPLPNAQWDIIVNVLDILNGESQCGD